MTEPLTELDERRRLAAEIIAASGTMPDAATHLLWLLGLAPAALASRLKRLRTEGRYIWRRADWRERAARKARGV